MTEKVFIVYKIRNKTTGLFSKGGTRGQYVWTKKGKTWSTKGQLKNHLRQYIQNGKKSYDYPYDDAEIVEIEVTYDECEKSEVEDMVTELMKKK